MSDCKLSTLTKMSFYVRTWPYEITVMDAYMTRIVDMHVKNQTKPNQRKPNQTKPYLTKNGLFVRIIRVNAEMIRSTWQTGILAKPKANRGLTIHFLGSSISCKYARIIGR